MSYPRSLQYFSQKLVGYSKNKFKITTLANSTAASGGLIEVELPSNTILDLRTLTMHATAKTSVTGGTTPYVRLPRHIETVIDRVAVDAGGTTIDPGCRFTNQIFKIFADLTLGADKSAQRAVLQNHVDIDTTTTVATDNKSVAICNWLGFLGCLPECLDMSLLPTVRIHIYLASKFVLAVSGSPTAFDYTLEDIYFTCDSIDISDGIYYQLLQQRMQSAPIEVVFDRYSTFLGQANSSGGSVPWSISTQSLDMVMGTLLTNAFEGSAGNAIDPGASKTSTYFKRGSANLDVTNSQLQISNVPYPQFNAGLANIWMQTIDSLSLQQDSVGGMDPNICGPTVYTGLTNFKTSFFVHIVRLNHSDPHSDSRYLSGLDTRGTSLNNSWNLTFSNSGTALQPLVICKSTSTLMIGAMRQLQVVY